MVNIDSRYLDSRGRYSDIKRIVDDPGWQALRKSLIGTWKEKPVANVAKLRAYLGSKPWTNEERLKRIRNYITGTGFRVKEINHPSIDNLCEEVKAALKQVEEK